MSGSKLSGEGCLDILAGGLRCAFIVAPRLVGGCSPSTGRYGSAPRGGAACPCVGPGMPMAGKEEKVNLTVSEIADGSAGSWRYAPDSAALASRLRDHAAPPRRRSDLERYRRC